MIARAFWERKTLADASATVSWATLEGILEDLLVHDLATAPHVAVRLIARLQGDLPTVREVAAQLSPDQRRGYRALPEVLPLVPPIATEWSTYAIDDADRDHLLGAALALEDELGVLTELTGLPAEELLAGAVGRHLRIDAGRVGFADPRLAIWLVETASAADRARMHTRLAEVSAARGDEAAASWHRARSSLLPDPSFAPELTGIARELASRGRVEESLRFAAEAAIHAQDRQRSEACLVAGVAAVACGFAADARDWLGSIRPSDAAQRAEALGALIVAETQLRGTVPEIDPAELRPRSDGDDEWRVWGEAAAVAAVLCAERGEHASMRRWLDAVREAAARTGSEATLRDPTVAMCWVLSGEIEETDPSGTGPYAEGLLAALRAAVEGDVDAGLRFLLRDHGLVSGHDDADTSPLTEAYRAVAEVLLLFWRGDIASARERLLIAAVQLPVAMTFAGLGVVLARRLDLAVLGQYSVLSRSLNAVLPPGTKIDHLVDRGIQRYLAGAHADAATDLRLWVDRGSPESQLAVPGLDEVGVRPARDETLRRAEPPELHKARLLQRRIGSAGERPWRTDYEEISEQVRSLRSPFARGRVEAMLGVACLIRGDGATGLQHLRAARSLFDEAGAGAWSAAMGRRLLRLGEPADESADSGQESDPLAACRVAWEPLLTARELEVAMLVVEGSTNREIAERLRVSVRTVEVHLSRVFGKLHVRTRVELTVLAHRTSRHL